MFDYESPKEKEPVDYTGLKLAALVAPVFVLVTFLYNADAGLAAYIVVGVMVFAIKLRWYLRKHIWFWAIIAVIFAAPRPASVHGSMAQECSDDFLRDADWNRGLPDHLGGFEVCRKSYVEQFSFFQR
jgi:hypothetical protein